MAWGRELGRPNLQSGSSSRPRDAQSERYSAPLRPAACLEPGGAPLRDVGRRRARASQPVPRRTSSLHAGRGATTGAEIQARLRSPTAAARSPQLFLAFPVATFPQRRGSTSSGCLLRKKPLTRAFNWLPSLSYSKFYSRPKDIAHAHSRISRSSREKISSLVS